MNPRFWNSFSIRVRSCSCRSVAFIMSKESISPSRFPSPILFSTTTFSASTRRTVPYNQSNRDAPVVWRDTYHAAKAVLSRQRPRSRSSFALYTASCTRSMSSPASSAFAMSSSVKSISASIFLRCRSPKPGADDRLRESATAMKWPTIPASIAPKRPYPNPTATTSVSISENVAPVKITPKMAPTRNPRRQEAQPIAASRKRDRGSDNRLLSSNRTTSREPPRCSPHPAAELRTSRPARQSRPWIERV